MSLMQYLHMIFTSSLLDQFNSWHVLLPQDLHIIVTSRISDQFSKLNMLLTRYLQTFVSVLVSADVIIKLSKDIYKTTVLQKNRKGLLELNWTLPKWMREKAHIGFGKYGSFFGVFGINQNILRREQVETLLSWSKRCFRLRLVNILSPDYKMKKLGLIEIIDTKVIQFLINDLYRLVHIPVGLTDGKGNLLASVGWQDVCTKFHRVHPETCKHCVESNIKLSSGVLPGEFKLYKCKNNMWDMVAPINVGGHVGYLYFGQFIFDDEPLDYEFFRYRARKYGFNEQEYITALEKVPRVSRQAMQKNIDFLLMLAKLLNHKSNSPCAIKWLIFRLKTYFA